MAEVDKLFAGSIPRSTIGCWFRSFSNPTRATWRSGSPAPSRRMYWRRPPEPVFSPPPSYRVSPAE